MSAEIAGLKEENEKLRQQVARMIASSSSNYVLPSSPNPSMPRLVRFNSDAEVANVNEGSVPRPPRVYRQQF
jgi:hypothetical protein